VNPDRDIPAQAVVITRYFAPDGEWKACLENPAKFIEYTAPP